MGSVGLNSSPSEIIPPEDRNSSQLISSASIWFGSLFNFPSLTLIKCISHTVLPLITRTIKVHINH